MFLNIETWISFILEEYWKTNIIVLIYYLLEKLLVTIMQWE